MKWNVANELFDPANIYTTSKYPEIIFDKLLIYNAVSKVRSNVDC
jgi:hypothetical protein